MMNKTKGSKKLPNSWKTATISSKANEQHKEQYQNMNIVSEKEKGKTTHRCHMFICKLYVSCFLISIPYSFHSLHSKSCFWCKIWSYHSDPEDHNLSHIFVFLKEPSSTFQWAILLQAIIKDIHTNFTICVSILSAPLSQALKYLYS